jgi:hypothetical protein
VTSQNYQPQWEIAGWTDRPKDLVVGGVANDTAHAGTAQMRTTQQQLPDPEPEPVQPPSIEDDF